MKMLPNKSIRVVRWRLKSESFFSRNFRPPPVVFFFPSSLSYSFYPPSIFLLLSWSCFIPPTRTFYLFTPVSVFFLFIGSASDDGEVEIPCVFCAKTISKAGVFFFWRQIYIDTWSFRRGLHVLFLSSPLSPPVSPHRPPQTSNLKPVRIA